MVKWRQYLIYPWAKGIDNILGVYQKYLDWSINLSIYIEFIFFWFGIISFPLIALPIILTLSILQTFEWCLSIITNKSLNILDKERDVDSKSTIAFIILVFMVGIIVTYGLPHLIKEFIGYRKLKKERKELEEEIRINTQRDEDQSEWLREAVNLRDRINKDFKPKKNLNSHNFKKNDIILRYDPMDIDGDYFIPVRDDVSI